MALQAELQQLWMFRHLDKLRSGQGMNVLVGMLLQIESKGKTLE
jgi:hypothetical protein